MKYYYLSYKGAFTTSRRSDSCMEWSESNFCGLMDGGGGSLLVSGIVFDGTAGGGLGTLEGTGFVIGFGGGTGLFDGTGFGGGLGMLEGTGFTDGFGGCLGGGGGGGNGVFIFVEGGGGGMIGGGVGAGAKAGAGAGWEGGGTGWVSGRLGGSMEGADSLLDINKLKKPECRRVRAPYMSHRKVVYFFLIYRMRDLRRNIFLNLRKCVNGMLVEKLRMLFTCE